MRPEKRCKFRLCLFPARSLYYDSSKLFIGRIKYKAVQIQKYNRGHCSGSFVSVYERMVFRDMEEIRGGHFRNIRMKE